MAAPEWFYEEQRKLFDLTGQRFGMLLVVSRDPQRGHHSRWQCRCDCGEQTTVMRQSLLRGMTKSCGCANRERIASWTTHGMSRTPTYITWTSMIARCENSKHKDYPLYGGRGIAVCTRWRESFENFLADMGEKPDGMSIDRFPNVDGNYEPGNVRWASAKEQANNRRKRSKPSGVPPRKLTPARRLVARWMASLGTPNSQIGEMLGAAETTIWRELRR